MVTQLHPVHVYRASWPLLLALTMVSPGVMAQAAAPDSLTAQMAQVRDLATSGQKSLAIQRYTALLAEHPGNGDLLLARGRAYAWDGQYGLAEQDLRTVVQNSPDYADAWSALGDLYRWSGHPQQAVDAYSHWVALAPGDPDAYAARGRAQRDMDQLALPRAANPGGGYNWSASLGLDHTAFSGGRQAWDDAGLSVRRHFSKGSLALEMLHSEHFGTSDNAWALDGYVGLWSRAYANLRYQQGPRSGILPKQAWRAEVFQSVGRGWELSASIDHLRFSGNTEFYGVGVGRYWGNWYARYKLQHVPGVGSGSWGNRLLLRNYYRGDAFDYWEVTAGNGRSTDLDRQGNQVVDNHGSIGVAWSHYLSPRWGFKVNAGFANDAGGYDEKSVGLSLYSRW